MREASESDDLVRGRLRAVLTGADVVPVVPRSLPATDGSSPFAASAPDPRSTPAPFRPGLSGAGLSGAGLSGPGLSGAGLSGPGLSGAELSGAELSGAVPSRSGLSGAAPEQSTRVGALTGVGAFDPGRRGVRALAALAVLVIVVAAVLAWRSRPRIDPVTAAPESVTETGTPPAPGTSSEPSGEVVVAVAGKIRRPGLVRLPTGARVADALQAAGGVRPGTDPSLLNLARKVVDGELLLVGVTPPPGAPVGGASRPGGAAPAGGAPAGGPVNLNTATLADLDTLPGVGPVLAQRILDHRDQHGGFKTVADLRRVNGIGNSRYEQLKDLVTV